MQCQTNGVGVNEIPKFLLKQPIDTSHAIVVDDPDGETPMIVPLSINGVTSYFICRKLTHAKFEDVDVPRIDFSAEAPDWDLSDQEFAERERKTVDFSGALVKEAVMEMGSKMVISDVSLRTVGIYVSINDNSGLIMEINVNVSNKFTTLAITDIETHTIMRVETSSSKRSLAINHEMVQARWGIHPALAKKTI